MRRKKFFDYFRGLNRKEKRALKTRARKMIRKKNWIPAGRDVEVGGLLFGSPKKRKTGLWQLIPGTIRTIYLRNKYMGWIYRLLHIGRSKREYELPGKIYTGIKMLLRDRKRMAEIREIKGCRLIGTWHSHPVGLHEPSKQDEDAITRMRDKMGWEVIWLGIEQNGKLKIFRYQKEQEKEEEETVFSENVKAESVRKNIKN